MVAANVDHSSLAARKQQEGSEVYKGVSSMPHLEIPIKIPKSLADGHPTTSVGLALWESPNLKLPLCLTPLA